MESTPETTRDNRHGNPADNVVLRRIRADDWARQRALRLEMLADTPIAYLESLETAEAQPDRYWIARAAERVASTTSAQWVIDAGGRLVGTMACLVDAEGRVVVVGVYLSPAYRGRRLLDRMLAEVARWARDRGITTMMLEVAQENERALEAYRKLGFVPTGQTHAHPLYPEVTEVEMTRPVDRPG